MRPDTMKHIARTQPTEWELLGDGLPVGAIGAWLADRI